MAIGRGERSETLEGPANPAIWTDRNWRLLWTGQSISALGDMVFYTTALLWIADFIAAGRSWAPAAASGALRTGSKAISLCFVTRFLYLVRHGNAEFDGPLSEAGRDQARLVGLRLADVPLMGIYHGPLERAAHTASIIASNFPGVPVSTSDLVGDYIPGDPDLTGLPADFAEFVHAYDADERAEGGKLAAAAIARFGQAGSADADTHELIVTHNLLIGWFVRQAMAAPDWRWLGLNQMNCGLTVIAYWTGAPPSLIMFNDAGHLPPELRWTGFPNRLKPPSR